MNNILYFGDFIKKNGPSSVDLALKEHLKENENITFQQSNLFPSINTVKKFFKAKSIHVSGISFWGAFFLISARILGKFGTYTAHGYLKHESKYRKVKKYRLLIENILLTTSNHIIVVSPQLKNLFIKYNKVIIIPNGVDMEMATNSHILFSKKNIITLVGGGRAEKRHLRVCQTINKIIQQGYSLKVNLFGEDGEESEQIMKYPFVHNFGFTNKKQLIKSLQESSIFIQYSSWESFSLSVADAINYKCKVITSNNVGINSYITSNSFYKIVHDDNELQQTIVEMLELNESYIPPQHTLSSWSKIAKKYLQVWNNQYAE